MNAIEIHDLTRTFPGFRLESLNLTLPSGCILGLIGENGAGKSTTIKLLLRMLRPEAGSFTVLGKQQPDLEDIGVVLDESCFPECLTGKQVGRIMGDIYRRWDQRVFEDYMTRLSVPMDKPFKDFSRGMKMKLSIAVALSHEPRLLILDEPTSGLDPVVRDQLLDIFLDFTREEDHSILISSHIVSDLEKICDYIAFLRKGKLTLFEEKDAIYEQFGLLHCTQEDLAALEPSAIKGKKVTHYGVEAIVVRDMVPAGLRLSPISIEELFVFMSKEENT